VTVAFEDPKQHEAPMRAAIADAEKARGQTGDNPWVGCAIADAAGAVVAVGHTQGPGEDHAEIIAIQIARKRGVDLGTVTLYSTLEPCSFHGRTPACARAICDAGVRRVVTGIRDPNPRVDGVGVQILRDAGVAVLEGVCAGEITHQLAPWILRFHPHEPARRARALLHEHGLSRAAAAARIAAHYAIDIAAADQIVELAGEGGA
jgi:diaminohydroxyphosphoribosylaminopyrimidine deaminase/5-amino-6-(5-phosphoribosylamino)uracil reductase